MKPMRTMLRRCVAFMLLFCLTIHVQAYSQQIDITVREAKLKDVLKDIRKQSGYDFVYNNAVLEVAAPISLNLTNATIDQALAALFKGQPLTYTVDGRTIIIEVSRKPARQQVVSGRVTDGTDNAPLSGVSVRVKGGQSGTVTQADGRFSIVAPSPDAVLVFSLMGYATQEIPVGNQTQVAVVLRQTQQELDAVVVQAYGTTRKSALTNSVATIRSEDIAQRPITNINTALAGAAPGIATNSGSGQPGAGPAVRIRGFGSINGSMTPLYILDGAPYDGTINNIDPNDIESISVLKDASAAALYGARAANGVIMITTKSGKANQDQVSLKFITGINSRGLSDYEKVGIPDYYKLMWETTRNSLHYNNGVSLEDAAILASGKWPERFASGANAGLQNYHGVAYGDVTQNLLSHPFNVPATELLDINGNLNPNARLLYAEDLDWRDAIRRSGLRQDYSLAYSGGTEKSSYYVSLNYLDDEGYSIESDFNRVTGRVKVDLTPKPWLRSGFNIGGAVTKTTLANLDAGINENPFYIDLLMGPIYPIHKHDPETGAYLLDENGERIFDDREYGPVFTGRNIVAETLLNTLFNKRNALNGRTFAEVSFLKDFKFTTNLAIDINNFEYLFYRNNQIGDGRAVGGRTSRIARTYRYLNFNQLLNYNKQFNGHRIDVLLGHESYSYNQVYLTAQRDNQVVEDMVELSNFANPATANSALEDYRTEGYFSRAEYSYADKYFASASFRRDGSSKFHRDVRWGNFWSMGLGWEISKEPFFNAEWLDYLKLRASYGAVGSDNLNSDYYYWQSFYNIGVNYGNEPGIRQNRSAGNRNLRWESNQSIDAAVEFNAFGNRLDGVIEVFHRNSDALLFNVPLPESSGMTSQGQNIGSMYNQGIELQLRGDLVKSDHFLWNMGINWTTFRNRITKLPQESIIDGTKKREVGRSIYDYWLRAYYGVNPENGEELYVVNPDMEDSRAFMLDGTQVTPNANNALYHYVGTAIPDFYGSVTNLFSYKNFSLNVMLMYQYGGLVMDNDYQSLMYNGTYGRALHVDALNRWQQPGDVTDVPKRLTGTTMYDSDRWLIDGSALSLRSATFMYNMPKGILSRLHVSRASWFVTGENLFMLSRRKGLDPTQAFTGVTSYTYAPARIISLGLNVTL